MNTNLRSESYSESESSGLFYLSDILRGIIKFWWLFLALAIIGAGAAYIRSYMNYVPSYSTSCTLAINTDSSNSLYSTSYNSAIADEISSSFSSLLDTMVLQNTICNDLDIPYVPAVLSAKNVVDTNMVILTVKGSDPQKIYDVINSVIKNYPSIARYMYGNTEINMITEPNFPTKPENRNKNKRSAVNGLTLGIALGVVWVFIYVIFRNTIRTKKDIKDKLGIVAVGVLPQVSFKKYNKDIDRSILCTNKLIGSSFVESLRLLRNTVIHNLNINEKIIAISSSAPGEGKTTLVVNLAISLSEMGKKVLIIDADIRNPSVSDLLKTETVFDNDRELSKIFCDKNTNVSFAAFNKNIKSHWKVIKIDYLQKFVDHYRDYYDYILIDTPPAGLIADASIAAQVADTALFVIHQDAVRVSRIKNALLSFTSSGVKLIGCVLNGAASGVMGYGENYGYGSYSFHSYKSYAKYYRYGEKNKSGK